jgi:hypothetical protein
MLPQVPYISKNGKEWCLFLSLAEQTAKRLEVPSDGWKELDEE